MGDTGWLVPTLRVFAVAMVNVSLKVSPGLNKRTGRVLVRLDGLS